MLVVTASVLWSSSGFFTQLEPLSVWPKETRGLAIAFWRALFALTLLLPLVRKVSWKIGMIPMALCFVTMNLSFLCAVTVGSPANTIWLQYLAPSWVMLGAIWIFGDKTVGRDWFMLVCCTAGVLFILFMEHLYSTPNPDYRWWAPILAIISGASYAGVILSMRTLPKEDPAWLIALNHIVTAVAVLPFVVLSGAAIPTGSLWLILAALGIFQMGLPYFLFAHGLKTTPSYIAALITLLEPVLLPIWVHITRSGDSTYQPPGWWTWVGAFMILTGLVSRYAFVKKGSIEEAT
ncbi:MAG: DMT family transporter [Pirellula sp.]